MQSREAQQHTPSPYRQSRTGVHHTPPPPFFFLSVTNFSWNCITLQVSSEFFLKETPRSDNVQGPPRGQPAYSGPRDSRLSTLPIVLVGSGSTPANSKPEQ